MNENRIIPPASPITSLGHVRILRILLVSANKAAEEMGLVIDTVYGNTDKRYVDVSARHAGPKGNHEPRWTDAEREQFAARGF
ncbi:TPA: hypothetical protein VDB83_001197 [Burkholderia cenocepacia]|uniref:hypothetical protein n=1 Tax=Burkholderia cenocepacia TaxID=95486 RepID=UPI001BA301B0|nr:hypothetical protein [Burkholderia cenocepacia]MBR8096357.1 hypothetical protein [Burkholderia cenocepacia]HEP6426926.1 hypothetical protein [Burkholderia cenocepacia]